MVIESDDMNDLVIWWIGHCKHAWRFVRLTYLFWNPVMHSAYRVEGHGNSYHLSLSNRWTIPFGMIWFLDEGLTDMTLTATERAIAVKIIHNELLMLADFPEFRWCLSDFLSSRNGNASHLKHSIRMVWFANCRLRYKLRYLISWRSTVGGGRRVEVCKTHSFTCARAMTTRWPEAKCNIEGFWEDPTVQGRPHDGKGTRAREKRRPLASY